MKKIIAFFLISILATGCASQGITSIKPDERDRSGKFLGVWRASAHVEKQVRVIEVSEGMARIACREIKFGITLYIAEGKIALFVGSDTEAGNGYIKEDGTFYVNGPYGENSGEHFVFSGHLGVYEGEGDVVISYGNPNQSCKGTITLKRIVGATTVEELLLPGQ